MLPMTGLSVTAQYNFASCVHILRLTSSFCFNPLKVNPHKTQRVQNISICWLSITQRALLTHVSRPCSDWTPDEKKQVETGRRKGLHSEWNTNGKDCIYGKVTACRVTTTKNSIRCLSLLFRISLLFAKGVLRHWRIGY